MTKPRFGHTAWRRSSRSGSEGQMCIEVAAVWRKSSHSTGSEGTCVEVAALWRKSSHSSGGEGQCVEVGVSGVGRLIAVRDSRDPDGPVLSFTPDEWGRLLARIKAA